MNIEPNDPARSDRRTPTRINRIRRLNDALRAEHRGGTIVATSGVAELGHAAVATILTAVAAFARLDDRRASVYATVIFTT